MRRTAAGLLATLIVAAAAPAPGAEPVSLRDEATGRIYGPFDPTSGAKVVIGTNTFTVVKPTAGPLIVFEPTIEQKLARTIIPDIDFRQANVSDVIDFLRQASEDFSPYKQARHKGVNFVTQFGDVRPEDVGTVTFKARQISLRDTLNAITSASDLEYELRDKWVLIRPKPKKK